MLKEMVFLTQTDTTIGFISQNATKLSQIKQRPKEKHYICAVNSLQTLTQMTRVPQAHKKRVRRSKQTTFILGHGRSYRLIHNKHHLLLLNRLKWAYTTSANLSHHPYDEQFAKEHADVIITPLEENHHPSSILKLGKQTLKRIR